MVQEKTRTPNLRVRSLVGAATEHPGGHHEVRLVVDQRLQHGRDLGGVVLAVGVQCDDVLRPELDAQGVAHPQRVAVAEVLGQHVGHGAGVLGHLVGLVGASVDHDEGRDREPTGHGRHGGQHRADVGLLLVGADQADDRRQLQVWVALVEFLACRRDDAARLLGIRMNGGAGRRAVARAQNVLGVAKTWRTSGSKCERGLVG